MIPGLDSFQVALELFRDGSESWVCEEVRASPSGGVASFTTSRMTKPRAESWADGTKYNDEHNRSFIGRMTTPEYSRLIRAYARKATSEEMEKPSFFELVLARRK